MALTIALSFAASAATVKSNYRVNMLNTGVDPDAKGTLTGTLSRNDNGSNQRLKLALSNLDSNTTYQLIAFLGDDTNYTDVAEFTTDNAGAFNVTYVQKCPTNSGSRARGTALPVPLDPISRIHQLDVVSGGNVVLSGVVGNDFPSDCTAATVILTDPVAGAVEVPLAQVITATFSEPMNPNSITRGTFTLKDGRLTVPGTVTYNNNTATFTPTNPLKTNTTFTATINTRAKDSGGNKLAADHVWTFTTASAAPIVNPTVDAIVPFDTATDIPVNQTLSATFNREMNPSTISPTTFTLIGPGGSPVTGTVTFDEVTRIATFVPAAPLVTIAVYTATLASAVADLDGNPLSNDFSWSFTTSGTTTGQVSVVSEATASFAAVASPISSFGNSIVEGEPAPTAGIALTALTQLNLAEDYDRVQWPDLARPMERFSNVQGFAITRHEPRVLGGNTTRPNSHPRCMEPIVGGQPI